MRFATVVVTGLLASTSVAAAGATDTIHGPQYLQLTFTPSAAECQAARAAWLQHHAAGRTDITTRCLQHVTASDRPEDRSLPPYVLEVTSASAPLREPQAPGVTITYRSAGSLHRARDEAGTDPTPPGTGTVREYQMLVFSGPTTPALTAQYNDWYEHEHVPDVLRVPGFVSGQRFVRIGRVPALFRFTPYLVEFTLRSADLGTTGQQIGARIKDGRTRMNPSFDGKHAMGLFATVID